MKDQLVVYRCYGRRSALLYIGVTGDLHRRFRAHTARTPWWHEVRRWTVDGPHPQRDALRIERDAIAAERPRYNVAGAVAPVSSRYTPRQVAALWQVTPQLVIRHALAGDLHCRVSADGLMTFTDADLDAFLNARTQTAHAP